MLWCLHVHAYLYVCACMCVCICVYMCMFVFVYVYVCVMTSRNAYLKVASDIFDITKCGYYLRVTTS